MKQTKVVVLVDLQKDFIDGSLGSPQAQAIIPSVVAKIKEMEASGEYKFIATLDTHDDTYLDSQEGRNLPVPHCVKGTDGHGVHPDIKSAFSDYDSVVTEVEKETFGSIALAGCIFDAIRPHGGPEEIVMFGLCTDICVISNVAIIKAIYPEGPVTVIENCCAGVTVETHDAAITVMKSIQVNII